MDTTKAQSGQVEGWNDCPPLILQNSNSSLNLPKLKRRAHRVGHISSDISSSKSVKSYLSLPRGSVLTSSNFADSKSDSSYIQPTEQKGFNNSERDLSDLLIELLNYSTSIPAKEVAQYRCRLPEIYKSLSIENRLFFNATLLEIDDILKSNKEYRLRETKQRILEFMMMNSGVSTWCSPLRKIVDNLNF